MKGLSSGRRGFLKTAFGAAAASLAARAEEPRVSEAVQRVEYGEPYELAGKRLLFLNWYYISTGRFRWYDESGREIGLESDVLASAAQIRRTDTPQGIRLVAQSAQRIGPLFEAEQPWEEGAGVALTTVIKDRGMFRGWGAPFTISGNPPGQRYFTYFESSDGLT